MPTPRGRHKREGDINVCLWKSTRRWNGVAEGSLSENEFIQLSPFQ